MIATPRALVLLAALPACLAEPAPELAESRHAATVCADGETTYGIDVSRYQGDIDWDQVAGSGVKFAFIQISRSLTDVDAKFPYNWQRAKEVGILRGAYQRLRPGQDVLGQANLFLQRLGPYVAGDLPPVLDFEDDDGLTPAQLAAAVELWVDHVEASLGVRPIIYTGYYFWRDKVGGADFSDHPLWIANYSADCPLVPPAWTRWAIHQYSSTATIPGITANTVDVNRFNGTLAELAALAVPPACGDGTCNAAETPDTCAADCAPCQVIDASDPASLVVDDGGACFTAGGDPAYMRTENAGFGSSLRWTYATSLASPSSSGRWDLHFARAGRYRVEAFTPAPSSMSRQAVYEIHHAGGVSRVTVDQTAVDGWSPVAELEFAAGGHGQFVRLDDNTGEPNDADVQLVFDALRFTPLDGPVGPSGESPSDDGGCATSRRPGALAVALVALTVVLLRRRRR